MSLTKLSTRVQGLRYTPPTRLSVFLWLDETKPNNLKSYGIDQRVPGFIVLASLTLEQLYKLSDEPWLMLVTQGITHDSRGEAAIS